MKHSNEQNTTWPGGLNDMPVNNIPDFDWDSGDTADWSTGADWAGGVAPTLASSNVTIAGQSGTDVSIANGESYSASSITLGSGNPELDVYGFLSLGATSNILLVQSGLVNVDGGTLANMAIQLSGSTLDLQNATLEGVSYSGTLNVTGSNNLYIGNGLNADGGLINLYGGPYGDAILVFLDSETLNNQTVLLGGSDNGGVLQADNGTVTLGINTTVTVAASGVGGGQIYGYVVNEGLVATGNYLNVYSGTFGNASTGTITIGDGGVFRVFDDSFENAGLITIADGAELDLAPASFSNTGVISVASGGILELDSGAFTNAGAISLASGAELAIQGSLSLADLDSIGVGAGSSGVSITGRLDLAGGTLTIGSGSTIVSVTLQSGGTIADGTIEDQSSALLVQSGTLDGVTYLGYMNLASGNVDITNGITFAGADGTGAAGVGLGNAAQFEMYDGTLISNVTFYVAPVYGGLQFYNTSSSDETLTLASSVTIDDNGNVIASNAGLNLQSGGGAGETVVSQGTILAHQTNGAGLSVYDNGNGDFINDGLIAVSNNDKMTFEVASFTNEGTFSLDDGTITLSDSWRNSGTINVEAGTLVLGGSFSAAELAGIYISNGLVIIDGAVDNAGRTLALGGGTLGNIVLSDVTISGGTIEDANGNGVFDGTDDLNGVTYLGYMNLGSGDVDITNGITFAGADGTGAAGVGLGNDAQFEMYDGTSLSNVTFYVAPVYGGLHFINTTSSDESLTLASSVTIDDNGNVNASDAGLILQSLAGAGETVVNQGTILAHQTNGAGLGVYDNGNSDFINDGLIAVSNNDKMTFNVASFTNEGTLAVDDGTMTLNDSWSNSGTINVETGTLLLGGSNRAPAFGNTGTIAVASGGELELDAGAFANTGVISLASGSVFELQGSISLSELSALNIAAGTTIDIAGTLDLGGGTLSVASGGVFGDISVENGTLANGWLEQIGGDTITLQNATLDDISYSGTLAVSEYNNNLYIENGLTASDRVIDLTNPNGYGGNLIFEDSETLNNQTLLVGALYPYYFYGGGYINAETTLTIGASALVSEAAGLAGSAFIGNEVVNEGQIEVAGGNFYIENAAFTNASDGKISIGSGAEITVNASSFENDAVITVATAAELYLTPASFTNTGTIVVASGGFLDLNLANYANPGVISLASGSTLEVQGSISLSELNALHIAAGTAIDIAGTLDLGGGTLSVASGGVFGNLSVQNGTLANGTLEQIGGDTIALQHSTLDGITYSGTIADNAADALYVEGGLTASGGVIDLTNPNGYGGNLIFDDNETLSNQTILVGELYPAINYGNGYINAYDTLTIGANAVISEASTLAGSALVGNYIYNEGQIEIAGGNFGINNNYFINAVGGTIFIGNGAEISVIVSPFENDGVITVGSGGFLYLDSFSFTNSGVISLASGSTLVINGYITLEQLENIHENDSADLEISGTLDLMGGTLAVGAGSPLGQLTLGNTGTIMDGTIDDLGNGLVFTGSGGHLMGLSYTGVAELGVASVLAPTQAVAGQIIPVTWTDENDGDIALVGTWSDEILLASDPEGDNATVIGTPLLFGTLAVGGTLTSTEDITLPKETAGNEYIVIKTNILDQIEQHIVTSQQTIASAAIDIAPSPQPALVVADITPPTSAFSGQPTEISWIVANDGNASTSSAYWTDNVYLSLDRTLDTSDILLASVPNPNYLAAGASYQNSAIVTLPQGIQGPYYIIVQTDVGGQIGVQGGNQIVASEIGVSSPFPVDLSPVPDLQIASIITAAQEFSGQTAILTWTVENIGSGATDTGQWNDGVYLSQDGSLDPSAVELASVVHSGVLAPGQSYTGSATVTLPVDVSGNFTFFVVADAGGQVYELGGDTVHAASTPVLINLTPPPDLEAFVGSVPTGIVTSHTLAVTYTVTNAGSSTTPNTSWTDTVYLSPDPELDANAITLGSFVHEGALDVGQSYSSSNTFVVPSNLSGKYYLIVQTDSGENVFELDKSNNIADSASPITIDFNPVDLTVPSVTVASTATAGHQLQVSWTVTNAGSGDTSTSRWADEIILSASGTLGAADNVVLGSLENPTELFAGGSYTGMVDVNLPNTLSGTYKLFVETNAVTPLANSNTTNNASAGQEIDVAPLPQLQVSGVTGPTADLAGDTVNVGWTVTNVGAAATETGSWIDNVYLSTGAGYEVYLGQVTHSGTLSAGASYSSNSAFLLPNNLASSDYYFVVQTDANNQVLQASIGGDQSTSAADSVTQLPSPPMPPVVPGAPVVIPASDLSISDVTAQAEVLSGQTLAVNWTLADSGNATTADWTDEIYLSRNQVLDATTDIALGSFNHIASLAAGASQTFTSSFQVPNGLSGPYYVFIFADAAGSLNDPDRGNNIAGPAAVEINLPPVIDLSVGDVSITQAGTPDTIINGETVVSSDAATVTYTVNNLSSGGSSGSWEDAIYLSSSGVWNVSDPLLGYVQEDGIAANGSFTGVLTTVLPGLTDGTYYAIVKTNVLDNQPNINQADNTAISTDTIASSVPTLILGTADSGTLNSGGVAYYQFTVAAGQTVDIAMTSDTAGAANDIYVGYNTIPTIGQFAVTSDVPFAQNPDAVIQESQPGTYYVLVKEDSGAPENYTLTASTVSYSITGVSLNTGSNLGSVTVAIDGADFDAGEQAELVAANGTALAAAKVYYVNSGEIWATFDLQGLSVGTYSIKIQDTTHNATLANGFTVTNARAGQLSVSLAAPSVLHTHSSPDGLTGTQNGIVTIEYTNTGDTDIPAPIFDLQAINAKFQADAPGLVGPSEITVVGTNQTGPAGILTPGAQETVSYTFTGNFGYAQFTTMQLILGTLEGSSATIDWASLEQSVRPASIDGTDWNLIWTRFQNQVGGTTESLLNALSQAATTLSQIGDSTNDLGTLLSYELEQASGTLPNITLRSSTDLADTGTGVDLSLTRTYSASLLNRDEAGAFGDGWTFTYGITATTDDSGNVYINSPAGTEFFTLNADGSYSAQAGDTSALTVVNGGYVLTDSSGTVETFNTNGTLKTITDANGNTVTVSYGSNGTISGVTSSNGQSLAFTTNATGQITSAVDGNGQKVTYTYDSGEHLASVSSAEGVTSYSYDASGNPLSENALTQITNPDGTQQNFTYDSQGNLDSQSGAGGAGEITYSYTSPGVVTATDANGSTSTLIYDANGNLAEVQDAAGNVAQLSYDANGDLTGVTLPGGATYSFTYDSSGNLTSYTDPLGDTVKATYEAGTNLLTSFTDQDGNTTGYNYDAAGNLTGITYDNGSGTSYTYAPNGALTASTDGAGHTTQYTYNAAGDLTKESFADGTSQSYTYDSSGNLLTATATDGAVTSYTYNAANELTSVTNPQGQTESYGYNSAGQEIQRVEPDGSINNYTYNAAGQIAELNDGNGNLLVKYTYNAAGQLSGAKMGNGASTAYTYDAVGNVTSITTYADDNAVTSQLTYTYDAEGHPVTATSLDGTWTYAYDSDGQVTNAVFASTNASVADQNLTYVYDAAGNRTETIFNGAVTNYTTNGLNQYTSANGTTYDYDANGNLVSSTSGGQTTTYTYNDQNELVSESGPSGTTTYQYDALGNQVSSTVNGVTSNYVIDPLAISTSATGPLSSIAQVYNSAGNATATYDYGNGLAAMTNGVGTFYYNTDWNGNVTSLSGQNGNLVNTYDYTPFGTVLNSMVSVSNHFQFSGALGVYTDTNGLTYMRARYYDPNTGRFLSEDPTGLSGGTNLYDFSDNSPIQYSDPAGRSAGSYFSNLTQFFGQLYKAKAEHVLHVPEAPVVAVPLDLLEEAGDAVAENAYPTIYGASGYATAHDSETINLFASGSPDAEAYINQQLANSLPAQNLDIPDHSFVAGLMKILFPSTGDSNNTTTNVAGVSSVDPNDIVGPSGYGTQNFVAASPPDAYTINCENAATATAPAQTIVITQQLSSNLDWRTFRLTGFGLGSTTTQLSGNQAFYSGLLNEVSTLGCDVQVTAGVNVETGVVTWTFQAIDPTTGQAPVNPEIGLLPPDDAEGDGEGFVSYTVQPNSNVQTGDTIAAQATVVFDTNAPINTPTITNTIDAVAPTSEVQALPSQEQNTSFDVSWSGADDPTGSGIASYTIMVSEDGGTPTVWLDNTTRTNAIFTGAAGNTYAFSSMATDNAGNVEAEHQTADTETMVACFAAGTRILTAGGSLVRVEDLREGDEIEQFSGEPARIKWIGYRTIDIHRHPSPNKVKPIRVLAGALGRGIPWRDLYLSPDHALYIEGHLIPAKALVNGFTVRQVSRDTISYYHVELAEHGVLFAEGAPAETYLETGNRSAFENGGGVIVLHPDFTQTSRERSGCAPFVEAGPVVEAVRQGILDRAGIETTYEPDMAVRYAEGNAYIESRTGIPGELTADPRDRRRLGVKVSSLEIDGKPIALDHPDLADGWHAMEADGRWTDGSAVIPACLVKGAETVKVAINGTAAYPLKSADRRTRYATGIPDKAFA